MVMHDVEEEKGKKSKQMMPFHQRGTEEMVKERKRYSPCTSTARYVPSAAIEHEIFTDSSLDSILGGERERSLI